MSQVVYVQQPGLPAQLPRLSPQQRHNRARYFVYGALSLAALAFAARGPGLPHSEFVIPDGVGASPEHPLRDGVFAGAVQEIPSGEVQVTATVAGGRIERLDVEYPRHERHSRVLNDHAVPLLADAALRSQVAGLDFVSGATNTSMGFMGSLQDAINQAAGR